MLAVSVGTNKVGCEPWTFRDCSTSTLQAHTAVALPRLAMSVLHLWCFATDCDPEDANTLHSTHQGRAVAPRDAGLDAGGGEREWLVLFCPHISGEKKASGSRGWGFTCFVCSNHSRTCKDVSVHSIRGRAGSRAQCLTCRTSLAIPSLLPKSSGLPLTTTTPSR